MTNLLELKTDFAYWNPDLAESDPAEPNLADLDADFDGPDVDSDVVPGTGTDEMTGAPVEEGQT